MPSSLILIKKIFDTLNFLVFLLDFTKEKGMVNLIYHLFFHYDYANQDLYQSRTAGA